MLLSRVWKERIMMMMTIVLIFSCCVGNQRTVTRIVSKLVAKQANRRKVGRSDCHDSWDQNFHAILRSNAASDLREVLTERK